MATDAAYCASRDVGYGPETSAFDGAGGMDADMVTETSHSPGRSPSSSERVLAGLSLGVVPAGDDNLALAQVIDVSQCQRFSLASTESFDAVPEVV